MSEIADEDTETMNKDLTRLLNSKLPGGNRIPESADVDVIAAVQLIKDKQKRTGKIEENRRLAKAFLEIARTDLNASRILYEKKSYSQSMYFLQQTAEKAAKAYGLYLGLFGPDELRDISHRSPIAFIKMLENVMPMVNIVKAIKPEINTDTDDLEDATKNKDKCASIAKMSDREIESIIILSKKLEDALGSQQVKDKIIELMGSPEMQELYETEPGTKEKVVFLKDIFSNESIVLAFLELYLVCCITFPHAEFSRYPDYEGMAPKDYNDELGIIRKFEDLTTILDKVITNTEIFIKRCETSVYGV